MLLCGPCTGAICGPASLLNAMLDVVDGTMILLGPTMNARVAFELSERLPHLPLRMQEHSRRALAFAERMQQRPGLRVLYPGLPDHAHHARLAAMANPGYGSGGVLCLDMGTVERANRLMHHLQNTTRFAIMAVSLGYYETLLSVPGNSTTARVGISPGLIRMSVGYNRHAGAALGAVRARARARAAERAGGAPPQPQWRRRRRRRRPRRRTRRCQ
jgi:methionine-gamma-lyase